MRFQIKEAQQGIYSLAISFVDSRSQGQRGEAQANKSTEQIKIVAARDKIYRKLFLANQ